MTLCNVFRPVKRGPALLQLDEQQQQTLNKRRLVSSFSKTPNSAMRRPLSAVTSLRGYVCDRLSVITVAITVNTLRTLLYM